MWTIRWLKETSVDSLPQLTLSLSRRLVGSAADHSGCCHYPERDRSSLGDITKGWLPQLGVSAHTIWKVELTKRALAFPLVFSWRCKSLVKIIFTTWDLNSWLVCFLCVCGWRLVKHLVWWTARGSMWRLTVWAAVLVVLVVMTTPIVQ